VWVHHLQSLSAAKIDSTLKKKMQDNWGLETLVGVGESWLPAMLEQVGRYYIATQDACHMM
jgi:hypothetical protein